jgi:hypothetical protein
MLATPKSLVDYNPGDIFQPCAVRRTRRQGTTLGLWMWNGHVHGLLRVKHTDASQLEQLVSRSALALRVLAVDAENQRLILTTEARFHNLLQLKLKEGAITRGIVIGYARGGSRVVVDAVEGWLPEKVTAGTNRLIDVRVAKVDVVTGQLHLFLV